jgi:hypothetical protein
MVMTTTVRSRMFVLASAGYIFAGSGTAFLAGSASSPAGVKAWRLGSWILSLLIFACHFAGELRFRTRPRNSAGIIACAVALGAFGVAVLGPLRAHWGEPDRSRLALLSIVAWPLITGVPAFFVALCARLLVDRARRPSASESHSA